MQEPSAGPLAQFAREFSDYLPTLAAGVFVLALGVAAGWVAKRIVVRVLIWLRLDRLGGRVGWRAAFGKGDVRAALYNLLGSLVGIILFLVFLDNALQIFGLTVLSRMIDRTVFYLPNFAIVAAIVLVGLLIANYAAEKAEDALEEEGFVHARLLGRMVRSVLLFVVGALALWQLNLAKQIVLAAFLIAFGAIGVAFAVAVGLGSAKAIQQGWASLFDKKKSD